MNAYQKFCILRDQRRAGEEAPEFTELEAFEAAVAELFPQPTHAHGVLTQSEARCTCPSGNGSLRRPCPVHPPEQATAQPAVQQDAARMSKLLQCCTEFQVKYHPDQRPRQMTMVIRDSVETSIRFREELRKAIDQFTPVAITTQEEA